MLGPGLSIGGGGGVIRGFPWPLVLFAAAPGHWTGRIAPPAFAPGAVFRAIGAGHWPGGFTPA